MNPRSQSCPFTCMHTHAHTRTRTHTHTHTNTHARTQIALQQHRPDQYTSRPNQDTSRPNHTEANGREPSEIRSTFGIWRWLLISPWPEVCWGHINKMSTLVSACERVPQSFNLTARCRTLHRTPPDLQTSRPPRRSLLQFPQLTTSLCVVADVFQQQITSDNVST